MQSADNLGVVDLEWFKVSTSDRHEPFAEGVVEYRLVDGEDDGMAAGFPRYQRRDERLVELVQVPIGAAGPPFMVKISSRQGQLLQVVFGLRYRGQVEMVLEMRHSTGMSKKVLEFYVLNYRLNKAPEPNRRRCSVGSARPL